MLQLIPPLVIGFIGSAHCLGMCGPLVLAYSFHLEKAEVSPASAKDLLRRAGFFHHLAFHVGRLLTYGLLGAAAAGLFQAAELSRLFYDLRNGMTLFGGILLIFFGLMLLRVVPLPGFLSAFAATPGTVLCRVLPPMFRYRGVGSRLTLGLAAGLLPCCLSWAMIVTAATTQNLVTGFLTMIAFGLGTVPALFLAGISASFLSLRMRFLAERIAALSVMTMGLILVLKGARILA